MPARWCPAPVHTPFDAHPWVALVNNMFCYMLCDVQYLYIWGPQQAGLGWGDIKYYYYSLISKGKETDQSTEEGIEREREREREQERAREREREQETERDKERQRETERDRERQRETERWGERSPPWETNLYS